MCLLLEGLAVLLFLAFLSARVHLCGRSVPVILTLLQALMTAERNLLQISYACASPLLSDKGRFPTVRYPRPLSVVRVVVGSRVPHGGWSLAVCAHGVYEQEPCTCSRRIGAVL